MCLQKRKGRDIESLPDLLQPLIEASFVFLGDSARGESSEDDSSFDVGRFPHRWKLVSLITGLVISTFVPFTSLLKVDSASLP